jgi:hypothetical protein
MELGKSRRILCSEAARTPIHNSSHFLVSAPNSEGEVGGGGGTGSFQPLQTQTLVGKLYLSLDLDSRVGYSINAHKKNSSLNGILCSVLQVSTVFLWTLIDHRFLLIFYLMVIV